MPIQPCSSTSPTIPPNSPTSPGSNLNEHSSWPTSWMTGLRLCCRAPATIPKVAGANMAPAFAGAPLDATADPRYLIPYDNPVATTYPAAVSSPGATTPEIWQEEQPTGNRIPAASRERRSPEQFFRSRDRDQDGVITLEEFIGNPEGRNVPAVTERFRRIDANGDGKLQLDELREHSG